MLTYEKPDAAWITVPPSAHGEIEYTLIDHHIPMFIEKPISAGSEPANSIGTAISRSGLIVGVGYHWRALDVIPELRETLKAKPAQMVAAEWHDTTPSAAWWQEQSSSGGQMMEQATHLFDIARSLVGEAEVVTAIENHLDRPAFPNLDVATASSAVLQYQSGAIGIFSATCLLNAASRIAVNFICDGLEITLTQNDLIYNYGNRIVTTKVVHDPYLTEDLAFIEAVKINHSERLFCSYADAVKTQNLLSSIAEKSANPPAG